MSDSHDPTDEAHQPHDKHVQPGDPGPDVRVEIADELKDALWADACTVDEYAEGLRALAGHDPDELAAHDEAMRQSGVRA